MFERFTDPSRRVVVLAQEEARQLGHNYIGTEHILLGLLREGESVADPVVDGALEGRLSREKAREAITKIIGESSEAPSGHIPFTPRAKKVLELSLREAMRRNDRGIKPAHLLLGLLREGEGVAVQVLVQAGLDPGRVRQLTNQGLDALADEDVPPESELTFEGSVGVVATGGPSFETDAPEVLAQLRDMSTDSAAAALDRAAEGGVDGIPTPWSLLQAIAASERPAADVLADVDLSASPSPPSPPVGRPFLMVFQRARGLANALGHTRPVEGPAAAHLPRVAEVDTLHLLAVLLSPGEGSVADDVAARGADPVELRRQVLALF